MSRAREIVSLTLDAVFKLGGFVVFIAQGLSGLDRAGEHPVTLIVAALCMGVGEFVLPYGVIDMLRGQKARRDE